VSPEFAEFAEEIIVTPAMKEAGREMLLAFDGGYFDDSETWAEKIYRAME
jgi:hypothetical protein